MILQRLYELAHRPGETILDDPAFERVPVPYVVMVGEGGSYLGVEERRNFVPVPSRRKGAPPKQEPDKGHVLSVPRAHGNTATQGFARYFADTLPRVLPVAVDAKDREKADRSRATFWAQIERAATETDDPALRDLAAFGRQFREDEALAQRIAADVAAKSPDAGDRCTLAWDPDKGPTVVERPAVRAWFSRFLAGLGAERQQAGPVGLCQITGAVGPLPASHPTKFQGVPGGMSVGVSLVSFDKDAFQHYGLDGAANAGIGYPATEAYSRALAALIQNAVAGNSPTCLRVGGALFLFWTRAPARTDFMALLEEPEAKTELLQQLRDSVTTGQKLDLEPDPNLFYVLALSGNAARAVVRDYLERPLERVRGCVRAWFDDLRVADTSRDFQGRARERFPLWQLANATALEADRVAPDTHTRLLHAALTGGPMPDSVLAACLGRLRVPDRDPNRTPFTAPRLALVKLCLIRKGVSVSETLDPGEKHPAYLYGRLLRVFEEVQYAALGDVNANVVDKFYGTFSAAPALVFARLFANAQNHLRKLRGDKPGPFVALDRRLTELCAALPPAPPRGALSLADQGRFALGYYHQKAQTQAEIAERKAEKARPAETTPGATN
ncbi:MAG TPA: type I-C CRISPR-associated protein Cas8c/Csd1 [Gemmata sp.]